MPRHADVESLARDHRLAGVGRTFFDLVGIPDPDRVDVARFAGQGGPSLLSFGAGQHFCLGAALVRMTLRSRCGRTSRATPT